MPDINGINIQRKKHFSIKHDFATDHVLEMEMVSRQFTSKPRSQSVIVAIQQSIQDSCEYCDVIIELWLFRNPCSRLGKADAQDHKDN